VVKIETKIGANQGLRGFKTRKIHWWPQGERGAAGASDFYDAGYLNSLGKKMCSFKITCPLRSML
jgi:hypothetical protein